MSRLTGELSEVVEVTMVWFNHLRPNRTVINERTVEDLPPMAATLLNY